MEHKNLILYAHGSAYNHGCEAIVRSTARLLSLEKERSILFSNHPAGDLAFGLDRLLTLRPVEETPVSRNSLKGLHYRMESYLHREQAYYQLRSFGREQFRYLYGHGDVALSIGGDNYCYENALWNLDFRNYWLNRSGVKTILWGASLTEEFLHGKVLEDLNRYALIVVREKLSYDLLRSKGIRTEVVLAPDPAFALPVEDTPWPDGREHKNVIGINISHFATGRADDLGLINYRELIHWILRNTDMEVALIPHVVFPTDPGNNDILDSRRLMEQVGPSHRVFLVEESLNCCQLKSLISKCRLFVGARTHATIAAYSTGVPTLVLGYSNKSIGIARDLFGTEEGYVCSVIDLQQPDTLLTAFRGLLNREEEVRQHLTALMPTYLQGHKAAVDAVNRLLRP